MTSSTNPDELAKYIQYRLGMLGEENAHHRFEELCFRIARATVASHLLPPTGPVSAGGDQGRDFESFRVEGAGGNVTRIFAQSHSNRFHGTGASGTLLASRQVDQQPVDDAIVNPRSAIGLARGAKPSRGRDGQRRQAVGGASSMCWSSGTR